MATPHAVTALLAILPTAIDLPAPAVGIPLGALAILAVQAAGVFVARDWELPTWRRVWLLALATTAVLFPLLALQTAASRVPFVSLALGSAWSLLWSTIAAAAAVVGLVVLAAVIAADAPDQASILFAPAALLVPSLLGAPGELDEQAALAALAETAALAAVAVFLGWLLPRGARSLVAPVALAVQFGLLWLLGWDPVFAPGRGTVVPACAIALLVVTVLAAVLVPVIALAARQVLRAARTPRPPTQPPRP